MSATITDSTQNVAKNTEHYDQVYRSVNYGCVVRIARNVDSFLADAIKTDTSWHGLYLDGFADKIRGKKVLELGCGDGLNAIIMAKLGADVFANDISSESGQIIIHAANELGLTNVRPLTGDFAAIPMEDRSFDFVVGKAFLHHLTEELEAEYMDKVRRVLKKDGEARFFEPAVNSLLLDKLRWMVPVSGRPSSLSRKAFAAWKANDPHPDRDNSSRHYQKFGERFFESVSIRPIGSIERLCRLLPKGSFNRSYRRWAHRMESSLPMVFRQLAARSQSIIYRIPRSMA
jgi:ubiquinone/menaquinone biosynthesis C-methylase UbiE